MDKLFSEEQLATFLEFEKSNGDPDRVNMDIQGNDTIVLENSVGLFLAKTIETCEVTRDGDLVVPYTLISNLTKQYLFVKRNRVGKLHKNTSGNVCRQCGSSDVTVERSPNGRVFCNICGSVHTNPKSESIEGCQYCGSHSIDISEIGWECRDCGCTGMKAIKK